MEVKDSSQQDKADNINIITDSNDNEEKSNNISDYNYFNSNYNNLFNNSFDSDTSNNSYHSVKTPHPYIKAQSSNIFMLGENLEGVAETKIENSNNYNNYSSFSPMRQMGYQRMRYSGKNLSHFSINNNNMPSTAKPTFSTFLRCNSTNVNTNPQMIFNTITSSFANNNILNSPMMSQNSSNNNINILDSPSNSFRLNHQGAKEFYTPQNRKKNKKKNLDIPRNKIHLESILRQKDKRTTIMIRHIPNKYTLKLFSDEINKSFFNKYDLLYLPVDIDNHCNLGFGFINFVDPIHIIDFYDRYCGKKWEKFNSDKICELAYAKVQGKDELLKHIEQNGITTDMPVYMTYDIKIDKKSSIELPMKYLQVFLNFYPYSLYRIVSPQRFAVDSFYNF